MSNRLEKRMQALIYIVQKLAHKTGETDIVMECAELSADIESITLSGNVDGRSTAWDEKRKSEFGSKIKAAHEKRREALNLAHRFLRYQYADEAPIEILSLEALAEEVKLDIKTIRNKVSENPDGFISIDAKTRTKIFYARSSDPEAIDRLMHREYQEMSQRGSIEGSGTYVLPSKKNKRF